MTDRLQRVSEELREVLAEEIQRLKDPRLGFVTVTGVRVTADLHKAMVFYTVLGEDRDHKATRAALRSATPRLRSAVGKEIRIKVTPELEFAEDDTTARGDRVEELLEQIHHQQREQEERGRPA
jgi:ribosome-binding factor A